VLVFVCQVLSEVSTDSLVSSLETNVDPGALFDYHLNIVHVRQLQKIETKKTVWLDMRSFSIFVGKTVNANISFISIGSFSV